LQRFACASQMIKSYGMDQTRSIEDAFQVLQAVKRDDTVWTIVYDIKNLNIHFFTNRQNGIKIISMHDFDFNQQPEKALNIHCKIEDNLLDQFVDFEISINRDLARSFFTNEIFAQVFQWNITEEMIDFFASYSEQYTARNN
jgi:choloylglycine hydrolase